MKVTIVGTGYVGLVTGACLASFGHHVACVDVSSHRVQTIQSGEAPFYEPALSELIKEGLRQKRLSATTELEQAIADSQISFIAVGTPPKGAEIDLSYVAVAATQIGQALRPLNDYHVVVVKSTVVPGTTENLVRQEIEAASGKKVSEFGLCMNPEFLREGTAVEDFKEPDRIVIGQWDERSGKQLSELYMNFHCPKIYTSLRNAEMIKYASNSLLALLVSFSNELASLCEHMPDADIDIVMDGLHLDRRLSPLVNRERIKPGILSYLRAGAGFGGSCLPKDVNALRAFARALNIETPLLDAVMRVNDRRPKQVVAMLEKTVGGLKGRVLTVLGLAFKPGTDDVRDSPALKIIQCLLEKGARVRAYDPQALGSVKSLIGEQIELCSYPKDALDGADAALVATAWPEFAEWDWKRLCSCMRQPIILDARNALRQILWPTGVTYQPIGVAR